MNDIASPTASPMTSRGEHAKNMLIRAAIAQFAEYGSHATTRDIAAAAGQNIAAIRYYFSGKDELYIACAQWIADFISEQFAPYQLAAKQLLSQPDPEKATMRQLTHSACRHLMRLMTNNETLNISRFLSREQLSPTPAYQLIHSQVIAPLNYYLAQIIGRFAGCDGNDINMILHAHAIIGEILAFRLNRETLLLCTGWEDFDEQKADQAYQIIECHINLILQGLSKKEDK